MCAAPHSLIPPLEPWGQYPDWHVMAFVSPPMPWSLRWLEIKMTVGDFLWSPPFWLYYLWLGYLGSFLLEKFL